MSRISRPFCTPDPQWWPVIAGSLAKPWPIEAIYADLNWWQDQERAGKERRPGRPTLCERWGVTDHAAKKAMKAEDVWGNPTRPQVVSPADHQPAASGSPADRQRTNGATRTVGRKPPADHQPAASGSPADRPTRVEPEDQKTRRPEDTSPNPHLRGEGFQEGRARTEERRAWVTDRATAEIAAAAFGSSPGEVLAAFEKPSTGLIDKWVAFLEGKETGPGGERYRQRPPGAPEGIRRRDIAEGLRRAVARWRGDHPSLDPPPLEEALAAAS